MDDSPINVTEKELAIALSIWIRTAPKRVWRDYWHHAELEQKWGSSSDISRFDPRKAMAEYIAGKFTQANWTVTHPKPPHPSSPPAWKPPVDPREASG